ncbi:MAG: ankyrin repeat domain-containing protein [Candidatus Thiodiazotropha sp.]
MFKNNMSRAALDFLKRVWPEEKNIDNVNIENELGENALHYAVIWNELEAAELLVNAGININKKGENGYTPLHEAVEQNNEKMVLYLVGAGANLSEINELGQTPAEMAKGYEFFRIYNALQKHNK